LRRAIALGIDVGREVELLREGSAVPAQSPITVNMSGYDAAFRSEMSRYDPARARAHLLKTSMIEGVRAAASVP